MSVHNTDPNVIRKAKVISETAAAVPAQPKPTRRSFRDITDQRFGTLTAKEYVGIRGRIAAWKCQCVCGNWCVVTSNSLLTGNRVTCVVCARVRMREGKARYDAEVVRARLPNLEPGVTTKPCVCCKVVKHLDEFNRNKTQPDGLNRYCRECARDRREVWMDANIHHVRDKNKLASRKYFQRHPERRVDSYLRCKYGIGLADYEAMLAAQGGGCAICGAPPAKRPHSDRAVLCVDHCHTTGKVRGLLCFQCNYGIGHFADTPALLEKAIAYLRTAQQDEDDGRVA